MVRIGIIGLGFMGRMHIAAYEKLDNAQLVAISDHDEKRAAGDFSGGWGNIEGAAEKLDMAGIRGTTDYHELLGWDDVDIVDICVPTPFHVEVATAALKSGKHVLCEKPLALSSDDARKIVDAAAEAKGMFMPAMCMRFWPQWRWLKQAVDEGRYGKLLDVTFRRVSAMPPGWFSNGEMSGGAILDLHVHDTDFVYHLLGMPRGVYSRGYARHSGKTDYIVTQYDYGKGGPIVSAEGSWSMQDAFGFAMRYTANFEKATADFTTEREEPLVVYEGDQTTPIAMESDGYHEELRYFVDCVANGSPPQTVTGEDAINSIKLVEAEGRSVETGEPVKL